MTRRNTLEDLWRWVDRRTPSECWPYTGGTTAPGWHGRIKIRGRMVIASRVAWELTYGPIPAGLFVLHACDTPTCCNPGHLMLGSLQANSVDAGRKGRMGQGKYATHCKRGHAFEGNTYIHAVTGRRSCHECIRLRERARPSRYAHVVPELQRQAVGILDEAVKR
jgi:hypothetical protein